MEEQQQVPKKMMKKLSSGEKKTSLNSQQSNILVKFFYILSCIWIYIQIIIKPIEYLFLSQKKTSLPKISIKTQETTTTSASTPEQSFSNNTAKEINQTESNTNVQTPPTPLVL